MKILLVHDKDLGPSGTPGTAAGIASKPSGGVATYLRSLEEGLRQRGCRTAVIRFTEDPRGAHELKAFRHRWRPSVVAAFHRLVEHEDPDVVHLHGMPALSPVLVDRLLRSRPVVWTFHDVGPFCFHGTRLTCPGDTLCVRRLGVACVTSGCFRPTTLGDVARVVTHASALRRYGRVPAILVSSRYMADLLSDHGVDAGRVEVAPLFSRFQQCTPHAPPPDGTARALFVGRLSHEKGIMVLLEALARLRSHAWTARIVGDGPLRDEARGTVVRSGLDQRVTWLGELDAPSLAKEYAACSLVVLPSVAPESFGLVGVEAMSFARPAVAFNIGGVVEWLADGVNGLLAPHGDVPEFAACIARLIASPALRDRLGRAGGERARAEFTRARHVDRVAAVYESVIDRRLTCHTVSAAADGQGGEVA